MTSLSIALLDRSVELRDVIVDRDLTVAGALLHDVSELFGIDAAGSHMAVDDLLDHLHYGVHLVARADLSPWLQPIALPHMSHSAVERKTIEAFVVSFADRVVAGSIFSEATGWTRPLSFEE